MSANNTLLITTRISGEESYEDSSTARSRDHQAHGRGTHQLGWHRHPGLGRRKTDQRESHCRWPRQDLDNGERRPVDLKVGDTVLFGKYSGTEVKMNDEEYLVMREDDIMGVITGK